MGRDKINPRMLMDLISPLIVLGKFLIALGAKSIKVLAEGMTRAPRSISLKHPVPLALVVTK